MSKSKADEVTQILDKLYRDDNVMETSNSVNAIASVLGLNVPSYRLCDIDSVVLREWGNAGSASRQIFKLIASWAPKQGPRHHVKRSGVVLNRGGGYESV